MMKSLQINYKEKVSPEQIEEAELLLQQETWCHSLSRERQFGVKFQPLLLSFLQEVYPEYGFIAFSEKEERNRGKGDFVSSDGHDIFIDAKIGIDGKYTAATMTQYLHGTIQFENQKGVSAYLFCNFNSASQELLIMALISKEDLREVRGPLLEGTYYLIPKERLDTFFRMKQN